MNRNNTEWRLMAVLLIAVVTILPFIGLTEFNSKGEPREAVVALSMLRDGNWILPVNNGGDIAYKPPFFHWCIALFSLWQGYVSEFTSRLPSAVALVLMTVGVYAFYARRRCSKEAFLTAMLTLTAFEVHRAGTNCRVDMVLTAFIVGAMLLLYRWWERGARGLPLLAVLCMSGATLTKGPVGIILPCFVAWVFMLLRRERFWSTTLKFALMAVLACVLPALWYVAAYREGGDAFLSLVVEENLGRFTGTMSYDSHVHPFTYNFVTLISGWLPWTLLVLTGAWLLPYKQMLARLKGFRQAEPVTQFTWLAFVLVLFFYCIPSSKRSVYLLPVYPFMAMLIARYIIYLMRRSMKTMKVYTTVIATLCILMTLLLVAVSSGLTPEGLFRGKHAADNMAMVATLGGFRQCWWQFVLVLLPVSAGLVTLRFTWRKPGALYERHLLQCVFICVFSLFVVLDGVILPRVMGMKSDRPLAEQLMRRYPQTPVYSYISTDMLHFFCADFYMNDRIGQFDVSRPREGVLMIPARDREAYLSSKTSGYDFTFDWKTSRRMTEVKDTIYFYRFKAHEK